jgi:hypothetical protein
MLAHQFRPTLQRTQNTQMHAATGPRTTLKSPAATTPVVGGAVVTPAVLTPQPTAASHMGQRRCGR